MKFLILILFLSLTTILIHGQIKNLDNKKNPVDTNKLIIRYSKRKPSEILLTNKFKLKLSDDINRNEVNTLNKKNFLHNKTQIKNSNSYNQLINKNVMSVSDYVNSDYKIGEYKQLSEYSSILGTSEQQTYPSLGSIRINTFFLNYNPINWLEISGGCYVSKYQILGNRFNDIGLNGRFKLKLNNKTSLKGFGQYSINAKHNRLNTMTMTMFPDSYYGISIEYKFNNDFGMEGGIIRELNPMNGKWQNRLFIAPFSITSHY